eukprot:TRINITY_DN71533_c0_g1_i1.p2 TRINITY_DN71533_c0_g1~~TRINITY_DN71533_c0_g1_i1.p2  ORF type:complete len:138 (-),score=14.48 TRINITY_DN71533_c0_g1_i1:116-529(-)
MMRMMNFPLLHYRLQLTHASTEALRLMLVEIHLHLGLMLLRSTNAKLILRKRPTHYMIRPSLPAMRRHLLSARSGVLGIQARQFFHKVLTGRPSSPPAQRCLLTVRYSRRHRCLMPMQLLAPPVHTTNLLKLPPQEL